MSSGDDSNVVGFRRRDDSEADQARWESFKARLIETMATCELTYGGLTSATLRALLEVLQEGNDMTPDGAKDYVAARLALFQQER